MTHKCVFQDCFLSFTTLPYEFHDINKNHKIDNFYMGDKIWERNIIFCKCRTIIHLLPTYEIKVMDSRVFFKNHAFESETKVLTYVHDFLASVSSAVTYVFVYNKDPLLTWVCEVVSNSIWQKELNAYAKEGFWVLINIVQPVRYDSRSAL